MTSSKEKEAATTEAATDVDSTPSSSGDRVEDPATSAGTDRKLSGNRTWLLIAGLACLVLAVVTTPRNDDPQEQIERGVAAHKAGRVDQATALYEEVLKREPANAVAHFNLGVAHQEAGRNAEAEKHYRQALDSNADFAPALFNLAILQERTGRVEEAVATYNKLLESNPNESPAHINLGYLYIDKLGNRAEAEAHFRKAVELDPNLISRVPEDIRTALQNPAEGPPEPPADPPPS